MKKLVTLFLAAGMLLTSVAGASAIEFKPSGNLTVGAAWYGNLNPFRFMSADDVANNWYNPAVPATGWADVYTPHKSVYRMDYSLNFDFFASEQLSGRIGFGHDQSDNKHTFGDGNTWNVKVTNMYFDWYIPNTPVEVRMGRWSESAVTYAVGTANPFSGSQDGVRLTANINDNVSVVGLWFRRNDTSGIFNQRYGNHTADQFFLKVPVTLDGITVTPWANYLRVQENSTFLTSYTPAAGTTPAVWKTTDSHLPLKNAIQANTWYSGVAGLASGDIVAAPYVLAGESRAWFVGVGGSITKLTPFTFAFDFAYSSLKATPTFLVADPAVDQMWLTPAQAGDDFMNRHGWMIAGSIGYKTDWGTPTLKGWYTTGDDDDITNGSERPIAPNNNKSNVSSLFGQGSDLQLGYDSGLSLAGTWGISAQWAGASFVDKLTHTLAFTYVRGNNDPAMAAYVANPTADLAKGTTTGFNAGGYMTKNDSVWALELRNTYKIYKELTMAFDMFYAWQRFDAETWSTVWDPTYEGPSWTPGVDPIGGFVDRNTVAGWDGMQFSNAWGIGLSFRYAF